MINAFRLLLLAALVPYTVAPASASEELRVPLAVLAEKALAVLPNNPKAVRVGRFQPQTGVPDHVTSGVGIQQLLIQELNARSPGVVREDAPYELNGEINFLAPNKGSELKFVMIDAKVVDTETGTATRIPLDRIAVDGNKGISEVLQTTAPRPQAEPGKERETANKELQKRVKEPSVHVAGTRISSRNGSHYEIEIVKQLLADAEAKKPTLVSVPAKEEKGLAFVPIARGEVYEINVYNKSGAEVAVAVSIDGIDMFHFSRDRIVTDGRIESVKRLKDEEPLAGRPRFTHFIMRTGEGGKVQDELTMHGWHHGIERTDNFRSFLVTAYGQGAHSKSGIPAIGQVGTIQVRFFECYPLVDDARPKSGDETGFGPSKEVKTRAVRYGIGHEMDAVAVRYTRPPEKK